MCAKILYTDLFEYPSDAEAQVAWVTDAVGLALDLYEYANDVAAQAAYVTSASPASVVTQSQVADDVEVAVNNIQNSDGYAQGFKVSAAGDVTKFTFKMGRNAIAVGTLTGYIYSDSAGLPNASLATFSTIDVTTLPVTPTFTEFDFTGTFTPTIGVQYHILWIWTDYVGEGRVSLKLKSANPYTDGEPSERSNSVWASHAPADSYFKLYQNITALQCFSEDTTKQQGSYSLKVEAAQTGSLNETLTKSGLSIDLTDIDILKLWAYASRTGANIQIQIHDSGGTTSTKDIIISSATTWTEITWDISGISNANKDDIDSIIIKIINADSDNTFYVDNFFADSALQCYSEDTIKVQGDYSLKVLAVQTDSLNKTLTKTLTDYLDYSIQDVIKFDVRASRTGANIQLQIHDIGGVTSTHNINIVSANVWQTETWDISGITGTDRDTIDKIIIKISEAVAANTIYMDNLYSQVIVESAHVFIGG